MRKDTILTIDQDYINKYHLDSSFFNKKIVVYEDRYVHFADHKDEYIDESSYTLSVNSLFDIIQNPDFISYNQNNSGMEFVKTLKDHTLVAVRISNSKELKVRSMYPINQTKKDRLKNAA